ncbi:MAG TPA: hypothetical protein VE136_17565, partial [Anaerolineales bacterium]|nr:hypothetical protein [Anaerolineales bacterium]
MMATATTTTLAHIFRENEQQIYARAVSKAKQVGPHYATTADSVLRHTFELILNALIDYWEMGGVSKIEEYADWRAHLSFSLDFSPSEVLRGLDILPEQLQPYIVQSYSNEDEMLMAMSKMDDGIGLLRRHYTDRHFALQEQRLVQLHEGTISISLESNLERGLELTVNTARDLAGARFAALGVAGDNGKLDHLVMAGTNGEKAKTSGDLPKQILAAILRE